MIFEVMVLLRVFLFLYFTFSIFLFIFAVNVETQHFPILFLVFYFFVWMVISLVLQGHKWTAACLIHPAVPMTTSISRLESSPCPRLFLYFFFIFFLPKRGKIPNTHRRRACSFNFFIHWEWRLFWFYFLACCTISKKKRKKRKIPLQKSNKNVRSNLSN